MRLFDYAIFTISMVSLLSCIPQIRDYRDPPVFFIAPVHIYEFNSIADCKIYVNEPNLLFIDGGDLSKKIAMDSWNESSIINNIYAKNPIREDPYFNPIRLALTFNGLYSGFKEPVDLENWKTQFLGNYHNQSRTFAMGQGIIPTNFKTETFKVFTGDIYFTLKSQKIFKQHVKNLAGGIEIELYPEAGLIRIDYKYNYPYTKMYLVRVNPFPRPEPVLDPQSTRHLFGFVGRHTK
jgi:hypothetical protein